MNIIDILVLLILGYSLFAGMHKGFLASLLSLGGLVGSWFGAQKLFLPVAEKILSNSGLIGTLSQYLEPASFFEGITVSGVTASSRSRTLSEPKSPLCGTHSLRTLVRKPLPSSI